jgi:hypothetical protein
MIEAFLTWVCCFTTLSKYDLTDKSLEFPETSGGNGNASHGNAKHQAVLALDMDTWKQLIDVFDIKDPMIRHREEEHINVGKKGWYA